MRAWEQRKLGDLLSRYENHVPMPINGYWRLGIRSHCKGTFHTFVESGKELEAAQMSKVKAGNFILNITFAWEQALAITRQEDEGKLVSHRFPQFTPTKELDIEFFQYLMTSNAFKHHLELSSPGGAGRNKVLKISEMLKYEIRLPSIDEQLAISNGLNQISNLITLHQQEPFLYGNSVNGRVALC